MKRITLFLLLFTCSSFDTFAQDKPADPPNGPPLSGTIEAVEISGISEDRLSQQLRGELKAFVGQVFDSAVAGQFADRIQAEIADHVAAARTIAGTQPGQLRLIFVVARVSPEDTLGENVNEKYPIESVKIQGVTQSEISASLWNEMQRMVGQPLDDKEADRLRIAMQTELGRRYLVHRKVQRAERSKQLTVVYEAEKLPMLQWEHPHELFAYHSKQGMTIFPVLDLESKEVGNFYIGLGSDGDTLVERYKGFLFHFQKPNLGSERLGFRVEAGTYGILWKPASLELAQQLQTGPGTYRSRNFVEPAFAFAINPDLTVSAGLNNTELSMQIPTIESRTNRFGFASVNFHRDFSAQRTERQRREVWASYQVHTGGGAIDSDFVYTLHSVQGQYLHRSGKSMVRLEVQGGRISGTAPVYERFMLGNSDTLRGWNKFDIAPLGADRMVHGSFEVGTSDVRLFYDAGSVWNKNDGIPIRHAFGVTLGGGNRAGKGFLSLGFALRGSRIEPNFMIRLGGR
jgi:hypothetical protein